MLSKKQELGKEIPVAMKEGFVFWGEGGGEYERYE